MCRFRYKEDYELFKLYVTIVTLALASVICFFVDYRYFSQHQLYIQMICLVIFSHKLRPLYFSGLGDGLTFTWYGHTRRRLWIRPRT